MKENFPNFVREIDIQAQEAQRGSSKMNPKTPTPRCIIIKMPKVKDKKQILKAAREKSYLKGSSHKTVSWFLQRNFAGQKRLARNIQSDKKQQPRLLYPAKLSFNTEGHIKSFPDKKKLKDFITSKPVLYEMLKRLRSKICTKNGNKYVSVNNGF